MRFFIEMIFQESVKEIPNCFFVKLKAADALIIFQNFGD